MYCKDYFCVNCVLVHRNFSFYTLINCDPTKFCLSYVIFIKSLPDLMPCIRLEKLSFRFVFINFIDCFRTLCTCYCMHGVLTTFSTFNCCYITMTCILKVFFLELEGFLRGSVPMLMGTFTTTCDSSSVASDALLWHAGAPTLTYTSQHIDTKYTYN